MTSVEAPLILIAHRSHAEAQELAQWLAADGLRANATVSNDAAIEDALVGDYAALIMAVRDADDVEAVQLLRHAGYLRPIIGLRSADAPRHERCFDRLLDLPADRGRLMTTLHTQLTLSGVSEHSDTQEQFEKSELFVQLRHSFLLGLADFLKEIETAFALQDWENVGHRAHALKGTAASFGFMELAHSSKQLESLRSAGADPRAEADLEQLRRQIQFLLS